MASLLLVSRGKESVIQVDGNTVELTWMGMIRRNNFNLWHNSETRIYILKETEFVLRHQ